MAKQNWKPGNMVYPVPAVMVSLADAEGRDNIITIAWTGTVCSDPAMTFISVRKERFSHHMLKETGEFVINLTTEKLVRETDFCGVRSGRDLDKWEVMKLTREAASCVKAPMIAQCPVNIECRVVQVLELGSHDMFLAKVEAVHVDEDCLDEKGRLDLKKAGLIAYSHGEYQKLGSVLGTFGFSVRKAEKEAPEQRTRGKASAGTDKREERADRKAVQAVRGKTPGQAAGGKAPVQAVKGKTSVQAAGKKTSEQASKRGNTPQRKGRTSGNRKSKG